MRTSDYIAITNKINRQTYQGLLKTETVTSNAIILERKKYAHWLC